MCRIDKRVYVRNDGHESVFEDKFLCEKGRQLGEPCPDVRVRRKTYPDPTSSPVTNSPITPSFNTQTRRPSVSSRPSTRDGPIASLKPEIRIEIGSKKGGSKSYVSITTGKNKRSSTGSASGSDASHTIRTGYPEMSPPPLDRSHGTLRPSYGQQRNPSSDESFTGSSRVPSLYRTSDDNVTLSLATTDTSSGNHPIIHHGTRQGASLNDSTRGHPRGPASPYNVAEVVPRGSARDAPPRTERDRRDPASYATEILGRDEDRQRRRDERRQQEAIDREVAANLMRLENQNHKQVRFEPSSRDKDRAERRAENTFAAHEQRRAEDREHLRQQKKEQEVLAAKEAAAKEAAARRPKPSANKSKTRRESVQMTAAQAAEQHHLLSADAYQMQQERIKAEAIEREEQSLQQSALQQQQPPSTQPRKPMSLQERQQDPGYYDPRGGRVTQSSSQPLAARRPSLTGSTRPDLGRRPSTREPSASQPRQERRQAPMAYYNNPNTRAERRPSSSHSTNPFVPAPPPGDPWDPRTLQEALPNARGPHVGLNFPQPQQATHRMSQALYNGEIETDSEDEVYGKKR